MNRQHLRSWVDVSAASHFPIQNLPYGVFSTPQTPQRRVGVAIGERVLDLLVLEEAGLLDVAGSARRPVFAGDLMRFLDLGPAVWRRVREQLVSLLGEGNAELRDDAALRARALVPMNAAHMAVPVTCSGYTDFYSSKEHASNVGSMFRDPQHPLLPNWVHMPIAYNGRASSVVISGTPVRRPNGQIKPRDADAPVFGPCAKLDIELEMAFVVGTGSTLGEPIPIDEAENHIFGIVLMNDWSARDIQQWEYQPLGPFGSKSFATSISPWVVPLDALEPFRVEGPKQDPVPLPYLRQRGAHHFDIGLEVRLRPSGASSETTISRTNARYLYWSMAQQLTHHTITGCNVRPGDIMASGTISGATPGSEGSLLELTWNGTRPLRCEGGIERTFLEDGDEIAISGACDGDGYRVGFGEVRGAILPALGTHGDR